jgi:hypothetical protein
LDGSNGGEFWRTREEGEEDEIMRRIGRIRGT